MNHDPLCPRSPSTRWIDGAKCRECQAIREARADEREQAAQRIALAAWEANADVTVPMPVDLAVRAVRDAQGEC